MSLLVLLQFNKDKCCGFRRIPPCSLCLSNTLLLMYIVLAKVYSRVILSENLNLLSTICLKKGTD